jgi:multidrug resistance efflux pump
MEADDTTSVINIDGILDGLAANVRSLRNRSASLTALLERMRGAQGCFSEEEIEETQTALVTINTQIEALSHQLAAKIKVYETQVSVLEDQLRTRKEILESDNVVVDLPDLMNVFATQHASLLKELKDAKEFLRT